MDDDLWALIEPLLRALLADARTLSTGRHTIDLLIDQPARRVTRLAREALRPTVRRGAVPAADPFE